MKSEYMVMTDILQAIGNLVHDCPLAQDEIRECNGIPVILDCCKMDIDQPIMRERALFAVRNLLHLNPENQALIASLKNVNSSVS